MRKFKKYVPHPHHEPPQNVLKDQNYQDFLWIYFRSYDELDKCLGIAVPINIFISWLMLLLNSTLNLNHFNVFDVNDLIFGIIPEQIAQDSEAPSMLAILFFMFILLTSINTVAILSESMISNLQDNFELASKSRLITSSIFCLGSFSMGLFFIVPNGSQLLYNTNYALETASVVYIPFVVSVDLTFFFLWI